MRLRQIFIAVLIPGISVALVAGWLALQVPDPNAVPSVQQVTDRTISPYCDPLTLSECPSSKAAELRQQIADRVHAGWTNRRIDGWLIANFGAWLVGNPGYSFAKLFPAVAILGGTIVVALFLRRRTGAAQAAPDGSVADSEELEQIRRELDEFRMASE